jgi:hypothetical protein
MDAHLATAPAGGIFGHPNPQLESRIVLIELAGIKKDVLVPAARTEGKAALPLTTETQTPKNKKKEKRKKSRGAGIYRCVHPPPGVAKREKPNQSSLRSFAIRHNEHGEAARLVDGTGSNGASIKYIEWRSGGYSCFVNPTPPHAPFFELVQALHPEDEEVEEEEQARPVVRFKCQSKSWVPYRMWGGIRTAPVGTISYASLDDLMFAVTSTVARGPSHGAVVETRGIKVVDGVEWLLCKEGGLPRYAADGETPLFTELPTPTTVSAQSLSSATKRILGVHVLQVPTSKDKTFGSFLVYQADVKMPGLLTACTGVFMLGNQNGHVGAVEANEAGEEARTGMRVLVLEEKSSSALPGMPYHHHHGQGGRKLEVISSSSFHVHTANLPATQRIVLEHPLVVKPGQLLGVGSLQGARSAPCILTAP